MRKEKDNKVSIIAYKILDAKEFCEFLLIFQIKHLTLFFKSFDKNSSLFLDNYKILNTQNHNKAIHLSKQYFQRSLSKM